MFREPLKGIKGKKEDQRWKECDSSSRWKDPMSIRIVGGVKLMNTRLVIFGVSSISYGGEKRKND